MDINSIAHVLQTGVAIYCCLIGLAWVLLVAVSLVPGNRDLVCSVLQQHSSGGQSNCVVCGKRVK